MVAPGFLTNPEVRRWLGGVEPAWMLLDFESFNALREEPSRENRALSLASDLTDAEIAASAATRSTLILLERAHDGDGLKLTATGNLSRNVVAEMVQRFEWPGFKPAEMAEFHKVINEPDFLPLHVIRQLVQAAKLVRRYRGALRATDLGNKIRTEAWSPPSDSAPPHILACRPQLFRRRPAGIVAEVRHWHLALVALHFGG